MKKIIAALLALTLMLSAFSGCGAKPAPDAAPVETTAAAEVAKIVNGAGEGFDTLKDIAEWIASDTTNAQQMA